MHRLPILAAAFATLAAGCTVGPNYRAETPALPPAFAGPRAIAPPPTPVDLARWWQAFDDPELQRLIAIGLAQGPDLQLAASRVRQARTQVVIARAAGLPDVSAAASGQYQRFDRIGGSDVDDLIDRLGGGQGGGGQGGALSGSRPNDFKLLSAGFDARWTIDIFGGVRRQTEAARDQAEAALWDARDARVMLTGEIARTYFELRGYQQQARVASDQAASQARNIALLEHTSQVGLVPQGNVVRQRTTLAATRARIAPLEAQALTQIHALGVLLGEPPERLIDELKPPRTLPAVPPAVPPGLPIDLIRRRPDVRAAERRLAAATAQIGVSVAQLYPQVSLTAMPSLGALWLGGFFLGKSLLLSSAGQASFPILDFGRRRAQVDAARERREQAYVQWRQAVLGALRDVEDALVRLEGERRANRDLAGGVIDAERSLRVNRSQFTVGLETLQPVLDAQNQLLQITDSKAQSDVRLREDMASLYLALGGGWSEGDADPVRPTIVDEPRRRR